MLTGFQAKLEEIENRSYAKVAEYKRWVLESLKVTEATV
jgi:hypothetical protein